jgi:hypothetical protein
LTGDGRAVALAGKDVGAGDEAGEDAGVLNRRQLR